MKEITDYSHAARLQRKWEEELQQLHEDDSEADRKAEYLIDKRRNER